MSQAKNSTEVLRAVEWIIQNVGWTKHANFRDKKGQIIGSSISQTLDPKQYANLGSVCLEGAVFLVEAAPKLKWEALVRLNDAVVPYSSAMSFNDSDFATKERVIALVRKAIEKGNG